MEVKEVIFLKRKSNRGAKRKVVKEKKKSRDRVREKKLNKLKFWKVTSQEIGWQGKNDLF